MKSFKYIFLLSIIVLSSCSKKDYVNIEIPNKFSGLKPPKMGSVKIGRATISAFSESSSVNSRLNSRKNSSGGIMYGSRNGIEPISAVHLNPANLWIGDQAGMTFTGYADEFTMLPEWLGQQDNFYLGSLIKGNSISSLDMTPLSERLGEYQSRPISASISLPGKTVSGTYNPTELRTSEFYSKLFLSNNMGEIQKASFSYGIEEFTYYDELRKVFGSNAKVNAIFYSAGSTSSSGSLKISKKTGLVAKFTQKNFSLDMDVPVQGELYENLNQTALGGYWPAYISSITYGSTGILTIESDESYEILNSAYKKAFSLLGGLVSGGSDITESEKGVIGRSAMKIYFIGPNGAEAVKSIFSFAELAEYIKKGSTFSAQTPGVPISFKMKSLPDHKTLKNNFVIDLLVDKVWVKVSESQSTGNTRNVILSFFADEEAKVAIIAPAKVGFKCRTIVAPDFQGLLGGGLNGHPVWLSPTKFVYNVNHQTTVEIKYNMIPPKTELFLCVSPEYYGGSPGWWSDEISPNGSGTMEMFWGN